MNAKPFRGHNVCWFITIGINAKGASALEALGRQRYGLGVRASRNPSVAAVFPKDDIRFELTHGGCSCDLVPEGRDQDRAKMEKMRHRYEAQGWSQVKIARAIQAAEDAHSKSSQRRESSAPRVLFRNTVIEQARRLGGVRMLAHFYHGSQDEEQVACSGRRRIGAEQFSQCDYPEDVLLEIIA